MSHNQELCGAVGSTHNNNKKEDKQNDEEKRKTSWTGKIMHGQYARDIVEAGAHVEETWSWLHQQDLKKETEGLIIAAQDQALRTNYIKFRIDKTATSPMFSVISVF